jgi:MFS family permease
MTAGAVKAPRLFYGWWIVAATLVTNMIIAGTPYYAFSVFLKPLAAEFGWERAEVSAALLFYFIPYGAFSILAGRLTARFSARWLITSSALGVGASLLLLSSISTLWQFYALYAFLGVSSAFSGVPLAVLITNWFAKKRGRAMGIMQLGMSLGALVGGPFTGYLIQSFSWHIAYIALGALVLVLVIPLSLKVIRNKPEEIGLFPDGEKPIPGEETPMEVTDESPPSSLATKGEEKTLRALFISLPLWLIAIAFFLTDSSRIAVVMHQVSLFTDIGIPEITAATALGFTGAIGAPGKLSFGYLSDKQSIRYVTILCFILQALGIFLLTKVSTVGMMWLYVVVFGFSNGASPTLLALVVGKRFPLRHFGTIYGVMMFVTMIGFALGPIFAGHIYDVTQSYSAALNIFLIAYIVAIAAIYFAWGAKPKSTV